MAEKVPWTIYRPDEKSYKSTGKLEMNFSWSINFKPSNINLVSVSEEVEKKIVEFTYLTHTISWPTNITKKAAIVQNNLSMYVSTKYFPI